MNRVLLPILLLSTTIGYGDANTAPTAFTAGSLISAEAMNTNFNNLWLGVHSILDGSASLSASILTSGIVSPGLLPPLTAASPGIVPATGGVGSSYYFAGDGTWLPLPSGGALFTAASAGTVPAYAAISGILTTGGWAPMDLSLNPGSNRKSLVPASTPTDAASGKVLSADGMWKTQATTLPQGRLTLVQGNPVMTGPNTSPSLYYTAFRGNSVPIFKGTRFETFTIPAADLTINLPGGLNGIADVYVYESSGLGLCVTPVWAGQTRPNALLISLSQEGIWTNSSAINCAAGPASIPIHQGTYVGTVKVATGVVEFAPETSLPVFPKLFVYNAYNRVTVAASVTASNLIDIPTPAAGVLLDALLHIDYVVGLSESAVTTLLNADIKLDPNADEAKISIFLDGSAARTYATKTHSSPSGFQLTKFLSHPAGFQTLSLRADTSTLAPTCASGCTLINDLGTLEFQALLEM